MQILEKVHYSSENPILLTSLCWIKKLFWIKEPCTAKPYGFNDQIKGVGTMSSISCKKTNIYSLFNKPPRRKKLHGKRHHNKRATRPDISMSTLVGVDVNQQQIVFHFIQSFALYKSLPWSQKTLTTRLLNIEELPSSIRLQ